jgi:citrate lyase subunit beta/citryl-CoA lyase
MLRSLLFVPADRPERFGKAASSGADAIIIDLEDSVSPERKSYGRDAIREWLAGDPQVTTFVRVNSLKSSFLSDDLAALEGVCVQGVVLPKAEGADSVQRLVALFRAGVIPPILPIATETPAAVFQLGSYASVAHRLIGLTWGAEDLPAAIGATTSREIDGSYTAPYEMARSLTLFGAHAASVDAIETIFPKLDAAEDFTAYVARARRDGFTGMMAIHPAQIEGINAGFTATDEEILLAQEIVEAFDSNPGAGALRLHGAMIDRPHLIQARRVLAQSEHTI